MKTIETYKINGKDINVKMEKVESSNIQSVGVVYPMEIKPHDESIALVIKFFSGTYIYKEVPITKYIALRASGSLGAFFNTEIKGKYAFEKVG